MGHQSARWGTACLAWAACRVKQLQTYMLIGSLSCFLKGRIQLALVSGFHPWDTLSTPHSMRTCQVEIAKLLSGLKTRHAPQ